MQAPLLIKQKEYIDEGQTGKKKYEPVRNNFVTDIVHGYDNQYRKYDEQEHRSDDEF